MLDNQLDLVARSKSFDTIIANTTYTNSLGQVEEIEKAYQQLIRLLNMHRNTSGTIYMIGNGGSSAVVSHILTDFINVCKLRAAVLNDPALITCMSNDFGYENAYQQVISTVFRQHDILIAVSSSGKSPNICNAAKAVKKQGGTVITFSGFQNDNPLRQLGDLNFWLDCADYGLVEIGHLFLLHNLADRIAYHLKSQAKKQTLLPA